MNYLREINAFERRMKRAPLSANAQLLWYKLMAFANGLFWPEKFQIDNNRLMEMLNVQSLHTLNVARKELIEGGLVSFFPGKKGTPSTYRMVSVDALEGPDLSFMEEEHTSDFLCDVRDDITTYFGYTESLRKELAETVERIWAEFLPGKRPAPGDVREVFFLIKRQEQHEDGTWEMTFPEDKKSTLAYAFDQARQAGKINWKYIEGIYRNWWRSGLETLDQIQDAEYQREIKLGRL